MGQQQLVILMVGVIVVIVGSGGMVGKKFVSRRSRPARSKEVVRSVFWNPPLPFVLLGGGTQDARPRWLWCPSPHLRRNVIMPWHCASQASYSTISNK